MKHCNIPVVGGSQGALDVVGGICRNLPPELPVAAFLVIHTAAVGGGHLARILRPCSGLQLRLATDGDPVRQGMLYVAPGDRHLLAIDGPAGARPALPR